jgi:PAT family beta-lactamase induction signal transducer AmpG
MLLVITFFALAATNPVLALGWFAVVAVIGAFASATQDVVIDAWRIDVADSAAPLEILSTVYQLGYRIAALVGGALALVFAAYVSWPTVYAIMGGIMALAIVATFMAPDTERPAESSIEQAMNQPGGILPRYRAMALAIVGTAWGWAIFTIAYFMVRLLMAAPDDPNRPIAGDFTKYTGPWIVVATVIIPAFVAAWLSHAQSQNSGTIEVTEKRGTALQRAADHCYASLILPLGDLVSRLRWGSFIVLGLILSYRLCDSIWGPFAFPFYLEELHYTKEEVAFASKVFGVFMTIAGVSLGGIFFAWLGRMPTLLIGAAVAAASNLLYADLAAGAPVINAITTVFRLDALAVWLGSEARMVPLLVAISGENIAGGLAGAAFVAYLSTVASKQFSAVQYALLSSLTFLVGSLGRGALGEAIEAVGYAPVFRFTALLGLIAVAFCVMEWLRSGRDGAVQSGN